VGACGGAACFWGGVGLVWDVDVVDRGQAAEGAVGVVIGGHRLAGLEALAAGVGAGVGLDVLEAVGHALYGC
jgi:hypothetical protein